MLKILVCGAGGFMGRNIYEQLTSYNKYTVSGTFYNHVVPGALLYFTDLTRTDNIENIIKFVKPDIIIQAAATTSGVKDILERPYIHVTDNAVMNSLLLRACYENSVKHFIFLSCGVMYQPGNDPRRETDYRECDDIFPAYFGVGWTKVYIEKMCEFYSRLGRTKHTIIRHSNTYGPYDKYGKEESHMFASLIDKAMKAKDLEIIEVWGNGTETARDLIHVYDVCDFIKTVIDKQEDAYKLYNVGMGEAYTVTEVVEEIVKQSGKSLAIHYNTDKPVIPTKLALNCSRAKKELGWEPKISLKEGIKKTINWYKGAF